MDAVRVAVVDIGTNSTRLLIADVEGTAVTEVERRTTVTNMGRGVDHMLGVLVIVPFIGNHLIWRRSAPRSPG